MQNSSIEASFPRTARSCSPIVAATRLRGVPAVDAMAKSVTSNLLGLRSREAQLSSHSALSDRSNIYAPRCYDDS
jgi:hypothetical protein